MEDAMQFAVQEINDSGGILGRRVRVVSVDSQSNMQRYSQYAQRMVEADKAVAVFGGITSASREIIRPVLRRLDTLYFYNTPYEGGVCDRNAFCTGVTPAQNLEKLVPFVVRKWGKRIYIVAADYNYGQITSDRVKKYAADAGATVVADDFFPLRADQFGPVIQSIREARPDLVFSVLVGGAHEAFYRQWGKSGLSGRIPIASTTFNLGNEHVTLAPSESEGIVTSFSYCESIDNPANKSFVSRWHKRFGQNYPSIGELAVGTYQGVNLWAQAVKRAGSTNRTKVVQAMESGISIDGPSGKVTMDSATHHCILDIQIAQCISKKWQVLETHRQQRPVDTSAVCNLRGNPAEIRQFVVKP